MSDLLWQQYAFNKLKKVDRGIIWASVGEGKSRIALRLFAKLQDYPKICLIVCRRKAFYDWQNEIKKVGYSHWKVLEYNPQYPFFRYNTPTVWLCSCDMLPKIVDRIIHHNQIRMVIFDELYLFSNVKAARTKAAIRCSNEIPRALGLSGTIMPARDNVSLWGQASTIRVQSLLAENLTHFRSLYQYSFIMPGLGFRQNRNKPDSKQKILAKLQNNIVLHFPKSKRSILQKFNRVPMTIEQKKIIKQLKEEYYVKLQDEELEIKTATELLIKIQQISNGWIKDNTKQVHHINANKLSALEQAVTETLAAGERVLIWCAFRYDLEYLAANLPFATLQMLGGKDFDFETWKTGNVNVCLATEGSGSSVNHFEQVKYAKYFSMSCRWLDLQQSRGRTDRQSSNHTQCHYEYFFTEGSMDEHVFQTATSSGATERDLIKAEILNLWLKQNK